MLKIDTTIYKPIEFEVDGTVYKTKKITNRVIMDGLRVSETMQNPDISQREQYERLVDLLTLYTPLDRDWILDHMSPADIQKLMTYITDEVTKMTEREVAPPLVVGTSGTEPAK